MPLQATSGAASQDAFVGNGVAVVPAYIEDVFSTYLYTGNGASQTITNGIDLSGKGGLVWFKNRSNVANHALFDSARSSTSSALFTNSTSAQVNSYGVTFNSNGFSLGQAESEHNSNGNTYVSWTFRKQPKFFDIVTYTGNGTTQNIAHSLGSTVGCVIVKCTNAGASWFVWHRGQTAGYYSTLNTTSAQTNANSTITFGNNTTYVDPTSTQFTVGSNGNINDSGNTYVAYLFAHDAGGFGLTGTDNVISCGSFTTNGSGNATVSLGYEPQWVLIKDITNPEDWYINDIMRGMPTPAANKYLIPNTAGAEGTGGAIAPTSTGFAITGLAASDTYIYIAIRRGPMKVPTTGTNVFGLSARSGTGANATVTGGQTDDAVLVKNRGSAVASLFSSRLTGNNYLVTSTDAAQVAAGTTILQANPWDVMDGVKVGTTSTITNASSNTFINYLFKRAPSFFDEVCYTGTGSARTVSHNLAAVPELMIVKKRSATGEWFVYSSATTATKYLQLNTSAAEDTDSTIWNDTTPTSSVFSLGTNATVNGSGATFVAYLFSTCAGVSKVGSYTGTGATQTINCGFTGGARFVLIKRSDAAFSNWYVFDTARGMVSGTDPRLFLNTTGAEVNEDSVYTITTGFQVVSTAAALNASGGTYIFLAVA